LAAQPHVFDKLVSVGFFKDINLDISVTFSLAGGFNLESWGLFQTPSLPWYIMQMECKLNAYYNSSINPREIMDFSNLLPFEYLAQLMYRRIPRSFESQQNQTYSRFDRIFF